MANRKKSTRRPSTTQQRQQRRRRRQTARETRRTEREPDLIAEIHRALDSDPLALIAQASGILSALDPRSRDPFDRNEPPGPDRDEFVATLIDTPSLETSAMLAAIAGLIPEELARARIRREIATRPYPLPAWLLGLSDVRPYRAVELTEPLGDGEDIMLAARLADGSELTALVYVDHNLGSIVKDAFVIPAPIDEVLAQLPAAADEDARLADLDPADARARLADAIERGARTVPPCETDTWPACRPAVEWLCAGLPPGGTGYEYREWSDAELAEIAGRFLASPFGAGFDDEDHRGLLDSLLWYGWGYAGHPLRISPVTVEILLADWVPRKIVADEEYLAKLPRLMRAWIRFAHAERGIRPDRTADTLAAVDEYEPEYLDAIGRPRLQGPAALLARMPGVDPRGLYAEAGIDPDLDDEDDDLELSGGMDLDFAFVAGLAHRPEALADGPDWLAAAVLESLAQHVGGPDVLDRLDDTPVPDEPFDGSAVPADASGTVGEILTRCDHVCDTLLGVEYRTVCRRLLARIVRGDPDVLTRRGAKTARTAAAIGWAVCKGNGRITYPDDGLTAGRLLAEFGVGGSVSQRAGVLLRAARCPHTDGAIHLGTPELLVSAARRDVITVRDGFRAARPGQ